MQKICKKLKVIKAVIQHKDMDIDNKLLLSKEHTKYLRYCAKSTNEVDDIISAVDVYRLIFKNYKKSEIFSLFPSENAIKETLK